MAADGLEATDKVPKGAVLLVWHRAVPLSGPQRALRDRARGRVHNG